MGSEVAVGIFHWNHAEHAIIWALNNQNWSLIWRWWNNIFQTAVNCFFVHLKGLKFWIYSPWPSNFFSEINLFVLLLKVKWVYLFHKKITGYLQRKLQKSPKNIDLPCENISSFSWVNLCTGLSQWMANEQRLQGNKYVGCESKTGLTSWKVHKKQQQ